MKRFGFLSLPLILISLSGAAFAGSEYEAGLAAFAQAGPIDSQEMARLKNLFVATPEVGTPAPQVPGGTPPASFSLRGTGAITGQAAHACFGACNASGGHCHCYAMTGTANVTGLGNATFSEGLTMNTDDCTNTGDAGSYCCPGDGLAQFAKGNNTINMAMQGQVCRTPSTLTVHMNYTIVPSTSGKFNKSMGSGVIEKSVLGIPALPVWESATGMIQIKTP